MPGNPQERSTPNAVTADLLRRVRRLEAVAPTTIPGALYPHERRFQGRDLQTYLDDQGNEAFNPITIDTAAPFGAYIDSIGTADGLGIYFGIGALGPRSAWGMDIWTRFGSDQGKIQIDFATTPADEFAEYGYGSDVSIADPFSMDVFNPASFTGFFATGDTGVQGDLIDTYHASSTAWDIIKLRGRFWIAGADGTMLTATGTDPGGDPFDTARKFDAGGDASVAWWVRLRSNGKNAASSGYGLRIAGFRMYRINGQGARV